MVAVFALFGIALGLITSRTASRALSDENKRHGISTALHLGARIVDPLLAMDYLRMRDLLDEVVRTGQEAAFVFVLDQSGRPLVHTFTGGFPTDLLEANPLRSGEKYRIQLLLMGNHRVYDFAVPVSVGDRVIGTVRLGISQEMVAKSVKTLLWTILLATGIAVLVSALVGAILSRTVTRRIEMLHLSAQEIVKGNLDLKTLEPPRVTCWEFMNCNNDQCPAYGNLSQRCWYLSGTLCPSCPEGEYSEKIDSCKQCYVYWMNSGDEIQQLGEYFEHMALTLKRRMEELKVYQERMVQSQKLESLGRLAAGVAHELNTPLGIILGYTQLLLRDFPPDSEAHESLRVVERHCRVCKKIVSDLLGFSRSSGTQKKPIDLNLVLKQVLGVMEHSFELDRITLHRELCPDLPLVFGDQEKLLQVFLNLLKNACDAIGGSEGRITVTTACDPGKEEVTVTVADTGPGIPMDIRNKIFDPFFTTKAVGKGSGLGLSVSFGIIRDHGGSITLQSVETPSGTDAADADKSSGAVFSIQFPVYKASEQELASS
jgi:signal transduction histidine kinase